MKLKTKFQDEDFELGEVVKADVFYSGVNGLKVDARAAKGGYHTFYFDSLKELTDMFEDYEGPKKYWIPMSDESYPFVGTNWEKEGRATGLISLSKEENDRKRQKLQAWKRLKDKGFRFGRWQFLDDRSGIWVRGKLVPGIVEDLDAIFGGEE